MSIDMDCKRGPLYGVQTTDGRAVPPEINCSINLQVAIVTTSSRAIFTEPTVFLLIRIAQLTPISKYEIFYSIKFGPLRSLPFCTTSCSSNRIGDRANSQLPHVA